MVFLFALTFISVRMNIKKIYWPSSKLEYEIYFYVNKLLLFCELFVFNRNASIHHLHFSFLSSFLNHFLSVRIGGVHSIWFNEMQRWHMMNITIYLLSKTLWFLNNANSGVCECWTIWIYNDTAYHYNYNYVIYTARFSFFLLCGN